MLKLVPMAYTPGKIQTPVIHVSILPGFIRRWQRGRYAHDPTEVEGYFNRTRGFAYADTHKRPGRSVSLVLRFPNQNLAVPLHQDGSPASMEAAGFYHERDPFQLGRKKMKPAEINGTETRPGVVNVLWKAMYWKKT